MSAPHLAAGQVVAGRYTIRALLGFTGEAATYHAVATTGHEVVLKLLDPAIAQRADVMGKLERVHATLAQLPIELCIPVADSGYDMQTGAPFSVCECVTSPSLRQLCEQGPLPPEVVARVAAGIAAALDAAHARQLYHLALKPANAFVGPAPDYPVRLADFSASVVRSTSPTHEAYAAAAPWWAPEQLQPAAVLGGPADVFTTALMVFYALTGRSYWRSCQASAPDLSAWQQEIMGARVPASQRAAELGVALPAALDDLFARALSINQAERPRSATELVQALAALAGGGGYRERAGGAVKTMAFPDQPYPAPQAGYAGAGYSGGHPAAGVPAQGYAGAADQSDGRARVPSGVGYAGATPASGYAAPAQAPAAMLSPGGGQQSPGLPPVPPEEKRSGSAKPIVIGVAVAVVLGGAAATFLFLRPRRSASAAAAPSAQASAAAEGPAAIPLPSAAPQVEPAAASSTASAESEASAPDAKVELTLICVPQCDELLVDNEKIDKLEEKNKISVLPGKHTLEARKAGYAIFKETIDFDKPQEKKLLLRPLASPPPPPRHCGQFLKCK